MMKYFVTLVTILFISSITAQKAQDGLKNDLMDYSTLLLDGQYETAMHYTPVKIFEMVPKTVLIETFTTAMNSKAFEMKPVLPTFNTFEKPFDIDGVFYQTCTYNQELTMLMITDTINGKNIS